jgi:hypothetical protein
LGASDHAASVASSSGGASFERPLHHIPCLGWKEFTPDYVGTFRSETQVYSDFNVTLPSMLRQVFPDGLKSNVRYVYNQKVSIRNGVLEYPEVNSAQ